MNKYRVTYWPGTGDMPSEQVASLSPLYLSTIARIRELPASSYIEACRISAAGFAASSDGCLIELMEGTDPTCCGGCKRGLISGECTNRDCVRFGSFTQRWNNLRAIGPQADPDRPEVVQFVEELLLAFNTSR